MDPGVPAPADAAPASGHSALVRPPVSRGSDGEPLATESQFPPGGGSGPWEGAEGWPDRGDFRWLPAYLSHPDPCPSKPPAAVGTAPASWPGSKGNEVWREPGPGTRA